jgi:tRNA threonylcarbamoyladenosine biosynthesis protein TsaE
MNDASLRYTLEEIQKAGNWLWELMQQNRVIALHGSMGAGKTTLVHTLCSQLEVKDPVSSPTFSLINEYQLPGMEKMYHIDLYRMRELKMHYTQEPTALWNGRKRHLEFSRKIRLM